jgi:hypothetical protein
MLFRETHKSSYNNQHMSSTGADTVDQAKKQQKKSTATGMPTDQIAVSFITYAFLLFIRVSGLASLFRYPHPANPLAAPPLRNIGEFIFFDAILLAVLGLACSGFLLALSLNDHSTEKYRRTKLLAGFGVGIPGIVYLLGSIVITVF